MNENNKPKSPAEILEALTTEANRIQQLSNEIDQKINVFYSIQKQFIENGEQITEKQSTVLNEFKNIEIPQISLDSYTKNELERLKEYENKVSKKDRTIPYFFFFTMLLLASFVYFFNQGLKTKKEVREDLFNEIYYKGDTIIPKNEFDKLLNNTAVINEWMDKNLKDSQSFKRFVKENN